MHFLKIQYLWDEENSDYTAAFIIKYQDRLVYGTDMGFDEKMYKTTFRILESADEHFYDIDQFNYHWPLYGLNLSKDVLKKLYGANAEKILNHNWWYGSFQGKYC